jgi:hypothetical protein
MIKLRMAPFNMLSISLVKPPTNVSVTEIPPYIVYAVAISSSV